LEVAFLPLEKTIDNKPNNLHTMKFILILSFVLLHILNAHARDPREIISRMDKNMRGDAFYSEMTMETVRPRYTREIGLKSWNLGNDFSLIYVTAPARDQGTAFLKRGNEIWNYVPNIDRTVKMPPSMMSQSWMGSDFSNDDLVRGVSTVEDYSHKLLRSESADGHECYVIELIPHPETPVVYEKVIYWVSKQHYLPIRVKNYDEHEELASTIHFREIKKMGGKLIPSIMEMVPADKPGHRTILTTHKADYNISLNQNFFSQQNLRDVR
jgi:outer membrane lipoprotein-sorting protein